VLNKLFGGWTGISLIPITFDWTQITGEAFKLSAQFLLTSLGYGLQSPLIPPWFAIANTLVGTVFWFVIVTSAMHFSGHWYSEYLPISDSNSYDNTGKLYNVTRILTPEFTLDEQKYSVSTHDFCLGSILTRADILAFISFNHLLTVIRTRFCRYCCGHRPYDTFPRPGNLDPSSCSTRGTR
jgi:hypothetical protein